MRRSCSHRPRPFRCAAPAPPFPASAVLRDLAPSALRARLHLLCSSRRDDEYQRCNVPRHKRIVMVPFAPASSVRKAKRGRRPRHDRPCDEHQPDCERDDGASNGRPRRQLRRVRLQPLRARVFRAARLGPRLRRVRPQPRGARVRRAARLGPRRFARGALLAGQLRFGRLLKMTAGSALALVRRASRLCSRRFE